MENLIKDMKLYTRSDKTACSRSQANQFRLFLHMGAYWLLHSARMAAPKRSRWRGATFATIRAVFVKIGCRVEELRTRIKDQAVVSCPPAACPRHRHGRGPAVCPGAVADAAEAPHEPQRQPPARPTSVPEISCRHPADASRPLPQDRNHGE
jgi:hypothetical protein